MPTKTTPEWIERLPKDACAEAVEWSSQYETEEEAWSACQRGDWMLWYIGHLSGEPGSEMRRTLTLCACECARLVLPFVPQGEDRPRLLIEAAESWGRGEHDDLKRINAAAGAAYAAADAADAAGAAYAAAYAADAAYAAGAAAYAAGAAYAADVAAYAADAAYAAGAADAADAAAYAAGAADAAYAADVAAYAADAAYAAGAADAAYAADVADVARGKCLADCADIVRKHYPTCPLESKTP